MADFSIISCGTVNISSMKNEAVLFPLPSPGTVLGFLAGDTTSVAYDINTSGQIVGVSGQRGFLYQDNAMSPLAAIGPVSGSATYSLAYGINDAGNAVGYSSSALGKQATLWTYGVPVPTGLGLGGGTESEAADINAENAVVGSNYNSTRGSRAFVWQDGFMTNLPTLTANGFYNRALAVNNNGVVVGHSSLVADTPVIWKQEGTTWSVSPIDLPAGSIASKAYDINDSGVVVGWSTGIDTTQSVPFVRTTSGKTLPLNLMVDKSVVNWTLVTAEAINNAGFIAGQGYLASQGQVAYLAEPVPCTDADDDEYCNFADCDDATAAINPGAAEVCFNGTDDNCNGAVDENCNSIVVTSATWSRGVVFRINSASSVHVVSR